MNWISVGQGWKSVADFCEHGGEPMIKVKLSRYRLVQAQRVDRGRTSHFRGLGARKGCVFSVIPGRFTPGKDTGPIVQEAG
jgi:hypothetical protein